MKSFIGAHELYKLTQLLAPEPSDQGPPIGITWPLHLLHTQQLSTTAQSRREGSPAFATPLVSPEATAARATQLFMARPGLLVQLVFHEYLARESMGWLEHQGALTLQFQLDPAKADEELMFRLRTGRLWRPTSGEIGPLVCRHQSGPRDDPWRWTVVFGAYHQHPPRIVVDARRVIDLVAPYTADVIAGNVGLDHPGFEYVIPTTDDQFWATFPPEKLGYLRSLVGGSLFTPQALSA